MANEDYDKQYVILLNISKNIYYSNSYFFISFIKIIAYIL